ncbi:MAG: sulfite exporter TauE/SafE family protein [Solirubrobacterales bacterium]|nr:sulfite exporter TauE/SafE family protein [Solirubrobacterales bacterium]
MDPIYIVFGLGVGILVGLTGIGGGSLMTPLLILVGGVSPAVAIGTDLAYGAITKTVGGWRHLRLGTVDLGISKWMAVGSVPGSLAGVALSTAIDAEALLIIVASALSIAALAILGRSFIVAPRETESVDMHRRHRLSAVGIGLVLGTMVGMTSVGSGALIGPILILLYRLTPHRVVGTDVFHAAILLWTAGIAHGLVGNVDYLLTATILIGSIPGVWLGTALLPRVPAAGLRPLLGCVLLAAALGIATKAGLELPAAGIVGPPVLMGALFFLLHRYRPTPAPREAPAT